MTAARPGQFTGATDDASEGGLFTDTLVDGIPDIVGADVLAAQTAATAAATSETNAATSETNAATSATTASTKAGEAVTSAEAAAGSAEAAADSAQEASDDVDSIGSSVTDAANSAQAALESESQAAASATAAGNAKTDAISARDTAVSSSASANNSAIAAAGSAAAAEATFDLFDDSYLGSKAADPTVDNDGDPLTDGDLYFNTTDNVMKVYDLGTTTWLLLTPTVANQNNINTVAGIQADVTTVAGIDSDVTTVAADASDISAVATNIANVNTVAGNDTNISTLAGIDSNITTVAGISANVTTVATNDANVTTVAGISGNVTTVAGISSDVTNVANDATDIGTVSTNITNVNTVATNITDVNSFADTYFISATAPASPGEGDLWYDSTTNKLKIYNGTSWVDSATAVSVIMDKQNYTATSNQTVFNVTYDLGFVDVFLNGVKLQETTDYTATNGTSITLTTGATVGDAVDLVGYGAFQIADTVPASTGGTFNGGIDVTGTVTMDGGSTSADFSFGDNDKAIFGAGSDLQIYHDGLEFKNADDTKLYANATDGGAFNIYYDNAAKLATTSTGIDVTGNATFDDNGKAIFGAGSDLQIYHNGNNSFITDTGAGSLYVRAFPLCVNNRLQKKK